jgi:anti-sigma B factor antagonist
MLPTDPRCTVKPLVVPEIVSLPAEIDIINAERVGRELAAAFGPGVAVVIADMSLTAFCDASGVRQLLIANDRAIAQGAQLRVSVASEMVLRVMQVIGADAVLHVYGSMIAALSAGRASPGESA